MTMVLPRSTCPNTPTPRSSARPPTPPPATRRCPTTATCAPLTRGSASARRRPSPLGCGCQRRRRCPSCPTPSRRWNPSPPPIAARARLSTAVALPVEHDPITLAKSIATLDHLSRGRVSVGVGFGWNTDELADHGVPAGRRRTCLREYIEAMRALWTQEEAAYDGEFVKFGPSWAWPKPVKPPIPVLGGG